MIRIKLREKMNLSHRFSLYQEFIMLLLRSLISTASFNMEQ